MFVLFCIFPAGSIWDKENGHHSSSQHNPRLNGQEKTQKSSKPNRHGAHNLVTSSLNDLSKSYMEDAHNVSSYSQEKNSHAGQKFSADDRPIRGQQDNQPIRSQYEDNQAIRKLHSDNEPIRKLHKDNEPIRSSGDRPIKSQHEDNRPIRSQYEDNQPIKSQHYDSRSVKPQQQQDNRPIKSQYANNIQNSVDESPKSKHPDSSSRKSSRADDRPIRPAFSSEKQRKSRSEHKTKDSYSKCTSKSHEKQHKSSSHRDSREESVSSSLCSKCHMAMDNNDQSKASSLKTETVSEVTSSVPIVSSVSVCSGLLQQMAKRLKGW